MYRPSLQKKPSSAAGVKRPPPSETSTVAADFQTGSSPMLSYTPPSLRRRHLMHASRRGPTGAFPPERAFGSTSIGRGSNTGGKQDDAATARASGQAGGGLM